MHLHRNSNDGDCVVDLQVASILVDDDVAMLVGTEAKLRGHHWRLPIAFDFP